MKLSVQDNIKEIPYYPKAMMYGLEDGWVRLSSNENPYPPSPEVLSQIMDGLFYVNRYPGNEAELKTAIGKHYGTKPEKVLIGNGSNELIEMSLKAMKHSEKNKVIISEPSFAFYAIASKIYGYVSVKAPLVNMKVELDIIKDLIDDRTRLIFLNNPNNPTGTIFENSEFKTFLKYLPPDILVVVDEAYAEFVESKVFLTVSPTLTITRSSSSGLFPRPMVWPVSESATALVKSPSSLSLNGQSNPLALT